MLSGQAEAPTGTPLQSAFCVPIGCKLHGSRCSWPSAMHEAKGPPCPAGSPRAGVTSVLLYCDKQNTHS